MRSIKITAIGLLMAALPLKAQTASAQGDIERLIARLSESPLDSVALNALEAHPPDPRILPALEAAFDSRENKADRQEIAATLIRLGDKAGRFFEFLSSFARQAVEDRTPFAIKYDSNGQVVKGEFSEAFANWCRTNNRDPKAAAGEQMSRSYADVLALAEAEDQRADAVFRQGLASPNPMVIAASVQGLGRLRDLEAISLIGEACRRLPNGAWRAIAMELPWYDDPRAYLLMEQIEPDRKSREFHIAQVQQSKLMLAKRVASRNGTAQR